MKLRSPSGYRTAAHFLWARSLSPLSALLLLLAPGWVLAQDPGADDGEPPEPLPCPTLVADDLTQVEQASHEFIVRYPRALDVAVESLDDGDVLVSGPDGYLQRAELVSLTEVDVPFIHPINPNADLAGDGQLFWPGGWPSMIAKYRVFPPEPAVTWQPAHNGSYAVSLVEGQVDLMDGMALAPKLLGGFRVAIDGGGGEPKLIQPVETRIHIGKRPAEGLFAGEPDSRESYATVQLFFDVPHIDVEFLELVRERHTFVANVGAVKLAMPDPGPRLNDGADAEDGLMVLSLRSKVYPLGALETGDYRFVVRVNGEREGAEEFSVGDDPPADEFAPEAELRVANITMANDRPQRLEVVYEDRGGIDVSTIGDEDLMVISPCALLDVIPPFPCDWETQKAKFVEVVSASDGLRRVVALYEIEPPAGGWKHGHNGFYPVIWRTSEVCDRSGNCNPQRRLGGFEVAIRPGEDPPVLATAEVRVDPSDPHMVSAHVRVKFEDEWAIAGQEIRRDGQRIILEARAEPLITARPPFPPPVEDLAYDIGPLDQGIYLAVFQMNGHVYARQEFRVGRPLDPPVPAEVRLEVDTSSPGDVVALVTVQFRNPHELVQEQVLGDGHRISLTAKARPLPVPEIGPAVLPEPIHLRYHIGELPPGGYLAVFQMNGFPYAAGDFLIGTPEPPIPAEVRMEVSSEDPASVVARVRVQFESPHVIVGRDLHRDGRRFVLEAMARPAEPNELPADAAGNSVVLEYPLGDLDAGEYGAVFVMNGYRYAAQEFVIRHGGEFAADVALAVDAGDPSAVTAHATIFFEDKFVIIENPGEPRREGNTVFIDATPIVATFVQEPEHLPIDLSYKLGEFRPGEYLLVYRINGNPEARLPFVVDPAPPLPAEVRLTVAVDGPAATARARIQFRDHYRISDRRVAREGSRFIIDLGVEGPLPILAPLPPQPIELEIPLADGLENGSYFATLRMNGFPYALEPFEILSDPLEVEVDLAVEVGEAGVTASARIDFKNPYLQVTDPGLPMRDGNLFEIHAIAEELVFVQEPDGAPQRFSYDLGSPPPGHYGLIYYVNGRAVAHQRFRVEHDPRPPLAHIAGIEISQGDASWFADVGVILMPGQRVTDWGAVRQSGGEFHVEITVDWVDFPPGPDREPIDPALIPDGVEMMNGGGDGLIGDAPVRIVRHQYVLGILDPGEKQFVVHSRGQAVARKGFIVPGLGPVVNLRAEDITGSMQRPHRFSISYGDPDGLDHESIREARVLVAGPDGFEGIPVLEEYASTDDVPSTGSIAIYTLDAPGGSWDPRDNGRYCVHVDPEAIRDLDGNSIASGRLGCFNTRIAVEPTQTDVEIRVTTSLLEGEWFAEVEIVPAAGTAIRVEDWGQVIHHGDTHLALATVVQKATPGGPIAEPLAHRFPLGALRPGHHVFVFKTNLAHCGLAHFRVPGMEGDPIDDWRHAAGVRDGEDDGDRDRFGIMAEYFFALDPAHPDAPEIRSEIVADASGANHLAIRYRRLLVAEGVRQVIEVSRDLRRWEAADGLTEIVQQDVNIDGTEELLVCLRESLAESEHRWIRIRLIREPQE